MAEVVEVVLYQPVCTGSHLLAGDWYGPHFSFKSEAQRWANDHDDVMHPTWLDDNSSSEPEGSR